MHRGHSAFISLPTYNHHILYLTSQAIFTIPSSLFTFTTSPALLLQRLKMPSYHRSDSPVYSTYIHPSTSTSSSSYAIPTGLDSPKMAPVTMSAQATSRHPTNAQLWTLHHFETHAIACPSCHHPYHVHRAGEKLCRTGRHLAESAADLLRAGERKVKVPESYQQVKSLEKAMQRSERHPRQAPIVRVFRSTSASSTERKAVKEEIVATIASSKKSKSTPSSPTAKPRRQKTVIAVSSRSQSSHTTPTSESTMPLKSILKNKGVTVPSSPVLAQHKELFFVNTPPSPPKVEASQVTVLPTPKKRQHSPRPGSTPPPTNYENFDVEIREPRKKARSTGVTRVAT